MGMIGGSFPTKVYIVGKPRKTRELTVGRSDNLLVCKHLDSPVREGSQQDCTKNSKGREPPIDGVDVGFLLAGRGGDVNLFPFERNRNPGEFAFV